MTTRQDLIEFRARCERIHAALERPQSRESLAAALGEDDSLIRSAMTRLRDDGLIRYVWAGDFGVWCRVEHERRAKAMVQLLHKRARADARAKRKVRDKARKLARRGLASPPCTRETRAVEAAEKREQRKQQLLAFVLAAGERGVNRKEICAALRISETVSQQMTTELRRAGLIDMSQTSGANCRWGPAGVIRKSGTAALLAKRRALRSGGAAVKVEEDDEADTLPVRQRIVSAADAPLPAVVPVNSVWALGAMV